MIHFRCVRCQSDLAADNADAGRRIFCQECSAQNLVPEASTIPTVQVSHIVRGVLWVVAAIALTIRFLAAASGSLEDNAITAAAHAASLAAGLVFVYVLVRSIDFAVGHFAAAEGRERRSG